MCLFRKKERHSGQWGSSASRDSLSSADFGSRQDQPQKTSPTKGLKHSFLFPPPPPPIATFSLDLTLCPLLQPPAAAAQLLCFVKQSFLLLKCTARDREPGTCGQVGARFVGVGAFQGTLPGNSKPHSDRYQFCSCRQAGTR